MVRDTIKRQSDVDAASLTYEVEPGKGSYRNGTITFSAQKGKSINLEKLSEDLKKTRLGKGTRSGVNWFEITAEGEVTTVGKEILLTVSGTKEEFTLVDDSKATPKEGAKTAYQRLTEALSKAEKVNGVTGRLKAWDGKWPAVLESLTTAAKDKEKAKTTKVLVVTDFQVAK